MNAVYILWLRQLKRYARSRARIIGSLGQPLLFLLAFGFGFGKVFQKAGEGDYLQFLAPGVICMGILFTAVFTGIEIIWDRQFGFLKETLVAPVSRLSIMVGRTLGGASVASMQGTLVLLIAIIAGFRPLSWPGVIPAIAIMLLVALVFSALGMMVASKLNDMQGFQLIMNFLVMPMFFLSGALFPLKSVSGALLWVARFDPLSYGVDALRYFLTGVSTCGFVPEVTVLAVVAAFFLWLGYVGHDPECRHADEKISE